MKLLCLLLVISVSACAVGFSADKLEGSVEIDTPANIQLEK